LAENSISVDVVFTRIESAALDITSTTEDGRLRLLVASGNGNPGNLRSGIEIEGDVNQNDGVKLGFIGSTPISRQVLAASPTAAQISTVLEAFGLTKFS